MEDNATDGDRRLSPRSLWSVCRSLTASICICVSPTHAIIATKAQSGGLDEPYSSACCCPAAGESLAGLIIPEVKASMDREIGPRHLLPRCAHVFKVSNIGLNVGFCVLRAVLSGVVLSSI